MKKENIFVGEIRKCIDYESYLKHGENYYIADFELKSKTSKIEFGTSISTYKIIKENAILIKINDDRYIWLDTVLNPIDALFVDLGFNFDSLDTKPTEKNMVYVSSSSLKSYYDKEEQNQKIRVKKLKHDVLLDPRLPLGIEH